MRPSSQTIRLGAEAWTIRPLTLAQVREIEPILMAGADASHGNVASAMAIVAVALARDHADAATKLGEVEATATEIAVAMATVLRLGGFIEAAPPGEAAADASTLADTSASTTISSPAG